MRRVFVALFAGAVALCTHARPVAFCQSQKSRQHLVTIWVFQPRLKRMPAQGDGLQALLKASLLRDMDKVVSAPSDSALLKQLRALNPHLIFDGLAQKISQKISADVVWNVPLKTEARMTLKIYDKERDKGIAQHNSSRGKDREWYFHFIKGKLLADVEVRRGGGSFASFAPIKPSVPYFATNSLSLQSGTSRGKYTASVTGSDIIVLTLKPLQ